MAETKTKKSDSKTGAVVFGLGLLGLGTWFLLGRKKSGAATLLGTVTSGENGTPIAGAAVALDGIEVTGDKMLTAITDSAGKFSIGGLKAGEAVIDINATGYLPLTQQLTIVAPKTVRSFQLFASAGSAGLTGVVRDVNTGAALPGAVVTVGSKSGTSGSDGAYAIAGLTPGSIQVSCAASGYKTQTVAKTLASGQNTLDFALNNLGTIQGAVTDSVTHAAIAGASVKSGTFEATTGANGTYSLTMPSGTRQITASKDGYEPDTETVIVEPELTKPLNFGLVQTFTQTGIVQGTVRNASNNNVIPGAVITFSPDNHVVAADSTGVYSIELPSTALGITYTFVCVAAGYQNYSGSISVRTGTINTKNISMAPIQVQPGVVQGVAYDRTNPSHAIAGATVRVVAGTTIFGEDTTDQSGFFSIPNIAPGNYDAWCSATGYTQMSKPITVISNQTTAVSFDMVPQGQAIGFYMQVDFDPSNYPTALRWYGALLRNGDPNDPIALFIDTVDTLWDGTQIDLSNPTFDNQYLNVELYDAAWTLLVSRIVPLGGAAGPKMVNGHTYSFNVDQARLYDVGPF